MKGSDVPGGSRWGGNPAMELAPAEPARPVRSPLDTTQGPQNDRRAALVGSR
jgi:hypothetical protein